MDKYYTASHDTLLKIAEIFSCNDEFNEFSHGLMSFSNYLFRSCEELIDVKPGSKESGVIMLKAYLMFGIFCKLNFEVIRDLVNAVEYEIVEGKISIGEDSDG